MAFRGEPSSGVESAFPKAEVVLDYLHFVAKKWNFDTCARYGVECVDATRTKDNWSVRMKRVGTADEWTEEHEYLVVANGHYSVPFIPLIPGIKKYKGRTLHSKLFRDPEVLKGKVLVVGGASSGLDISRLLVGEGREVGISAETLLGACPTGVERFPLISKVSSDGTIIFEDGRTWTPATIIFATGYSYSFPFLSNLPLGPLGLPDLRLHVLSTTEPTLAFLGLPTKVIPFPLAEYQSELINAVWTGRIPFPGPEVDEGWLATMRAQGVPVSTENPGADKRRMEMSGDLQWHYQNLIASLVGCEETEEMRWELRRKTGMWRVEVLGY
jgi:hypothetical protein